MLVVKSMSANAGDVRDTGSIPGLGRSPRGGNGNPLQYSCLGNPIDRGALVGCSPWGHKESSTTEHKFYTKNVVLQNQSALQCRK